MPKLIKSIAPAIPEPRCPGCLNLMRIVLIETMPERTVELTYRCDHCSFDTQRGVKGGTAKQPDEGPCAPGA